MSDLYGVPKRVGDPSRMVPAVLDAKELVRQIRFMWELAGAQVVPGGAGRKGRATGSLHARAHNHVLAPADGHAHSHHEPVRVGSAG